jgi:uncharacterized protein (TIGR02996 family)
MTTEDDFQRALDEHPDDWHTRLVFADWLDERGDPRGPGYRALGQQRRRAMACPSTNGPLRYILGTETIAPKTLVAEWRGCLLRKDWFRLVEVSATCHTRHTKWKYYTTRREAEDAAAHAFANLPTRRRTELLTPTDRTDS